MTIESEGPGQDGTLRFSIVAMTANAMQGDRETCIAAGMQDDATEPIRTEQLVEALLGVPPRKDIRIA